MNKEPFYNNTISTAQEIWTIIRKERVITTPILEKKTKLRLSTLIKILGRMRLAGLITIDKSTKPHRYAILKDIGRICPRLDDEGRKKPATYGDRMWMSIKALGVFTNADLSMAAEVHIVSARKYTKGLTEAGYLIKTLENENPEQVIKTGCLAAKFRFKKASDTGPLSPIVGKKSVYDRNKKKFVWVKEKNASQENEVQS